MTIGSKRSLRAMKMGPDLFTAATEDDAIQFRAALAAGQDINGRNPDLLNMTPLHLACIYNSNACIEIATSRPEFNPWLRDDNLRVAFDHAWAKNNKLAMRLLYPLMHPNAPPLEPA